MTWLFTAWAATKGFLKSIPRDVWYILGALALVWIVFQHGKSVGYAKCKAEYAEAARKAAEKAREADAEAGKVIDSEKGKTDEENQRARDAARGSEDPLKDGLGAIANPTPER